MQHVGTSVGVVGHALNYIPATSYFSPDVQPVKKAAAGQ
jgi:hypothetical protein